MWVERFWGAVPASLNHTAIGTLYVSVPGERFSSIEIGAFYVSVPDERFWRVVSVMLAVNAIRTLY